MSGLAGGAWRVLSKGTTIGYARLARFEPIAISRARLDIEAAVAAPGLELF